jgi:hypothetical protein
LGCCGSASDFPACVCVVSLHTGRCCIRGGGDGSEGDDGKRRNYGLYVPSGIALSRSNASAETDAARAASPARERVVRERGKRMAVTRQTDTTRCLVTEAGRSAESQNASKPRTRGSLAL